MTSTEFPPPTGLYDAQPAKILVINDSPDFLQMMREILTLEGGYEVATLDQSEGLLLQISTDRPDMVILDIVFRQSPTGPALAASLAESDDTRDLPVLFCTALAQHDIAEEIRQDIDSRNQQILFKPFDLDTLLVTVAEMLAQTNSPTHPGGESGCGSAGVCNA